MVSVAFCRFIQGNDLVGYQKVWLTLCNHERNIRYANKMLQADNNLVKTRSATLQRVPGLIIGEFTHSIVTVLITTPPSNTTTTNKNTANPYNSTQGIPTV